MGVIVGDWLAAGSNGAFQETATVSAPSQPTISAADDGSGSSFTVTVAGDAGVTNYVYYHKSTDFQWTSGGDRSGDGDVQVADLAEGSRYVVVAVSKSAGGVYSLPSDPATVRVTDGTTTDLLSEIAEAVKDEINAGDWSQTFTATREYAPIKKLTALDTLKVVAVPFDRETLPASRGRGRQEDYLVQVGVLKKFSTKNAVEIDPLMTLVDEIGDYFHLKRLDDVRAACVEREDVEVYSVSEMRQNRAFVRVLQLRFRTMR